MVDGADTAPHKLEVMRDIMEQGIAMVHLDPRKEGVQVPERFRHDPVLRLNFAYGFRLPALTVDDEGVYAILNFQGERAACNIPWSAVFAITAPEHPGLGHLWPEDVPQELVEHVVAKASRPALREVGVAEGPGETTKPDKPRPGPKPRAKLSVAASAKGTSRGGEDTHSAGPGNEVSVDDGPREITKPGKPRPGAKTKVERHTPPPDGPRPKGHLRVIK